MQVEVWGLGRGGQYVSSRMLKEDPEWPGDWTQDLLFYRGARSVYTHPFPVFTQCSPSIRGRGRPLLAGRHRQSAGPDKTRPGDRGGSCCNRHKSPANRRLRLRLLPTGSGRKEAAEGRDGTGRKRPGAEVEVVTGNGDRRAGRRQVSWHESAVRSESSRSGSGGNTKPPAETIEVQMNESLVEVQAIPQERPSKIAFCDILRFTDHTLKTIATPPPATALNDDQTYLSHLVLQYVLWNISTLHFGFRDRMGSSVEMLSPII